MIGEIIPYVAFGALVIGSIIVAVISLVRGR